MINDQSLNTPGIFYFFICHHTLTCTTITRLRSTSLSQNPLGGNGLQRILAETHSGLDDRQATGGRWRRIESLSGWAYHAARAQLFKVNYATLWQLG